MDSPRSREPLVPQIAPRPKLPAKAAKVEIDVLNIGSLKRGGSVNDYYDRVMNFLCGTGRRRRFIRWCKKKVKIQDFVVFVKFELNNEKMTLLIREYDIYIGGFMLENGKCFLLDRDMDKLVPFEDMIHNMKTIQEEGCRFKLAPPKETDFFYKCLKYHGIKYQNVKTLPIGDSYKLLEGAAKLKSKDVIIGVEELELAFKTLALRIVH